MRVTLLFSALAFVSLAQSQTVLRNGPEILIREAYENQRLYDSLVLELRGLDVNGTQGTPFHALLYWRLSLDPRTGQRTRAQAELDIYEGTASGDSLWMRIVGDGTSLFRYDIGRREVSTSTYGFFGQTPPGGYSGNDPLKLLSQLRTATPGLSAYLVRILNELNPVGASSADRYTDWLPGHRAQIFDTVPLPIRQMATVREADTVRDPISGHMFLRGQDEWVFQGMESRDTDRTVTFHIVDENNHLEGTTPKWVVQTVNVAQRLGSRFVDLTMNVNTGIAPSWAFVPYSGAQAAAFRNVAAGQ